MPSLVNAKATRTIWFAVDQIVAGKLQQAVTELCRLIARMPVPEVVNRRAPMRATVTRGHAVREAAGMRPKHVRIENPEAIRLYLLAHEKCEVRSCLKPATVVHHLTPVGNGGDDVPQNFLALCGGTYNRDGTLALPDPQNHHTGNAGYHVLGGRRWYARFKSELAAGARRKVERALRLVPDIESAVAAQREG